MRDLLTGLAIILIVILTTILVAPYFVDWNGQRAFLEARLTHALGQKVTIGGRIDLKVLPTPYLVLDQVVVGGDDGAIKLGIHHLDLELSLSPLFRGEFDIVQARLEEPTIRLTLQPDRTLPALPNAPAFQADVRFDHIRVSDATLSLADPASGRTFVFDHLDFDADAGSFVGPFKITGEEGAEGERTRFRLSTLAPENGRTRTRLVIDETPAHPSLEADGVIDLSAAANGTVRPRFDGNLVLAGHLQQPSGPQEPWRLAGPARVDPASAQLDKADLQLGSEDANLVLQATARVTFSDHPDLNLDLGAKQLDIDHLAGRPDENGKLPPPPALPEPAQIKALLAEAAPPLPTHVQLSVDTATYGGETLRSLQVATVLHGDGPQPLTIEGEGPGGTHAAFEGHVDLNAGRLDGTADLSADDLPRAAAWLATVAPWAPSSWTDRSIKTAKLGGVVTATPAFVAIDALKLSVDQSDLSGKAKLVFAVSPRPAELSANLKAETLDLDTLPAADAWHAFDGLDLDIALVADRVSLSQAGSGLEAGGLQLSVQKAGSRFTLSSFRAQNLDGARIDAHGTLGPAGGTLSIGLDASRLEGVTGLLKRLNPTPWAAALAARAAVLAPAHLSIDADFAKADGVLSPRRVAVRGRLGATAVDATASPGPTGSDDLALAANFAAPEGGTLLRQLGVPAVPMTVLGASKLAVRANGRAGHPLETEIKASLGPAQASLQGRFDLLAAQPVGSGQFHVAAGDLTPLLQTLAIAFPDLTGRIGAEVGGRLDVADGQVTLDDLSGRLGGAAVQGRLNIAPGANAPAPVVTGALSLDRLALADLMGFALGPPQGTVGGALWSHQPFAVGLIDPPTCSVALTVATLDLAPRLVAQNAHLNLEIAPGLVALKAAFATLLGGRLDGHATVRRDGKQATVEGALLIEGAEVRTDAFRGRLKGKLDLAGSGTSAAGLIASLAGSGSVDVAGLTIPGADPGALPKVFADIENDVLSVDEAAVARALGEAARSPLSAGAVAFNASLAAGVLHLGPSPTTQAPGGIETRLDADFDLARFALTLHATQTLTALPKDWAGPVPSIVVTRTGSLDAPIRSYDVSGFLDTLASRALTRETARIEAYELDLRERAFFNERLRSEQRREEERLKAEDDARRAAEAKAEADRKARAEAERKAKAEAAARQERLRREQAAKAAKEDADRLARQKRLQTPQAPEPPSAPSPAEPQEPNAEPPAPAQTPQRPSASEPTDPSSLGRY